MRESDSTHQNAQIFRQPNVKKCSKSNTVVTFYIDLTIHVDDEAVPFTSR